ncbi:M35 family metallo-endopeptidase [Radicibacter daui]|uniref:M35 family metallo-endopeptidase n=1 Tax=Radicibacter daui TaxID=3064829 RepID=UPI004046B4B9
MRRYLIALSLIASIVGIAGTATANMQIVVASGCSGAQATTIGNAATTATTWAGNTINNIATNTAAILTNSWAPYTTWFGAYDAGRLTRVNNVMGSISTKLTSSANLVVNCPADGTPPCDEIGDIAATVLDQDGDVEMWFCTTFFTLPPSAGYDTQAGTVIHEFSHAVGGTDDLEYGTQQAQWLATNNPAFAVVNADNYEFFNEDIN